MNDDRQVIVESQAGERLRLQVAFDWCDGRWAHAIAVVRDDEPLCVLRSIEGNSEQDFPPSPPLQQLHRTDMPDGRSVLLLVGMAGRSHWSVSCEAAPDRGRILFDVASRAVPACPARLGSTYQFSAAAPPVDDAPLVCWRGDGYQLTLRGLPTTPDTSPSGTTVEGSSLTIRPAASEQIPIRWKYELGLTLR